MSDKQPVFIYATPECPQYETLPWWKRALNKVGFRFTARMVIFGMPNGSLITAPANVFALRSKIEALGYPVHVINRSKGNPQ